MTNNENISFSIVICTYNRDEFLERTLKSLNNIEYNKFEVIVVNGPSTDRTSQILDEYKGLIKILNNPEANLSISRNMGINASEGDVVAFIDDDAIPEPNWLHQISDVYKKFINAGGAGGRVYGPGGDHFQFHNGIINVWGEADVKRELPGQYIQPKNEYYNIMMGVNSTFSRKALISIGGFDEYYEYYHDESDVCVRLINAGYPVYHHQEAYIHHEFAKSHIRKSTYQLNWYPIVKNTVYFGVKNSKDVYNILARITNPLITAFKRLDEFKLWLRQGNITKNDYKSFRKMWFRGTIKGFYDGFFSERKISLNLSGKYEFKQFIKGNDILLDDAVRKVEINVKKNSWEKELGICLISKFYPPYGNGGVATYTQVLAEGFSKRGYKVYVVTSGLPEATLNINGVNLIDVGSIPIENDIFDFVPDQLVVTKNNLTHALKVSKIVENLFEKGLISVVESPLWDYEGLIVSKIKGLKTFVRLETPLKVASETQGWGWNQDFDLSSLLEKRFIESAIGVITISNDIQQTIGNLYGVNWGTLSVDFIPLGIEDRSGGPRTTNMDHREFINILFLGRLERRKGIDTLLNVANSICLDNRNVKFIIAGNSTIPFEDNRTIREIFEKRNPNLKNQVVFLGEISEKEKLDLLAMCDIFVAPSRYESFGLVFLEAMQFGKPVVGTAVGGVKEIINDEDVGLLVDSGDEAMLEQALTKLINSPELRKSIGRNARERFLNYYSAESMIEETLKVYNKYNIL